MPARGRTRHGALTEYVLNAARQLNLHDWHIIVSEEPASDDSYADTEAHDQSTTATIRFSHRFWKMTPEEQRVTIVHELLHLDTWRNASMIARLEEQLGKATWTIFEPLWEDEWERLIDRHANRLAPSYPLPDLD